MAGRNKNLDLELRKFHLTRWLGAFELDEHGRLHEITWVSKVRMLKGGSIKDMRMWWPRKRYSIAHGPIIIAPPTAFNNIRETTITARVESSEKGAELLKNEGQRKVFKALEGKMKPGIYVTRANQKTLGIEVIPPRNEPRHEPMTAAAIIGVPMKSVGSGAYQAANVAETRNALVRQFGCQVSASGAHSIHYYFVTVAKDGIAKIHWIWRGKSKLKAELDIVVTFDSVHLT